MIPWSKSISRYDQGLHKIKRAYTPPAAVRKCYLTRFHCLLALGKDEKQRTWPEIYMEGTEDKLQLPVVSSDGPRKHVVQELLCWLPDLVSSAALLDCWICSLETGILQVCVWRVLCWTGQLEGSSYT